MVNQLVLQPLLNEQARFENFFIAAANQQLIAALKQTILIQRSQLIYLHASLGSGRSHLLQACCHLAHANSRQAFYLDLEQHVTSTDCELLDNLEQCDVICLDNIDAIQAHPEWEEAVFHLFNRVVQQQKSLIVAALVPATHTGIALPDLHSRLTSMMVFALQALSDDEKIQALVQRATVRGFTLPAEVARFMLTHRSRATATLFAEFDKLDRASLEQQRKFTIPFVKKVLSL